MCKDPQSLDGTASGRSIRFRACGIEKIAGGYATVAFSAPSYKPNCMLAKRLSVANWTACNDKKIVTVGDVNKDSVKRL